MKDSFEVVAQDLAGFADPGSVTESGSRVDGWLSVSWEENLQPRQGRFQIVDSTVSSVEYNNRHWTYAQFLASPDMGSLLSLARNTVSRSSAGSNEGVYVASRASRGGDLSQTGDALTLLRESEAQGRESEQTSLIFVSADAGVGKTRLLRRIVREQAEAYSRGETTNLWLYVDAQSRRLAALDEALSIELDRVRAKFSYEAAIPMVRAGILTVVIDGFDELIGSVGAYDEAFASLTDFISQLDGRGCVVAAARSAYYEQEFLARVNSRLTANDYWELVPIELRGWSEAERTEYVRLAVDARTAAGAHMDHVTDRLTEALASLGSGSIGSKPFFVTQLTQLALDDQLSLGASASASDILDHLTHAYLRRESTKHLGRDGRPLFSPSMLTDFFEGIASEMWRQESRELSAATVRELAQLYGEAEGLQPDDRAEIAVRAPYFAMLNEGSLPGSVGWEHDLFYSHYLADPLARLVEQDDFRAAARMLRRGRIPQDGAVAVAGKLRQVEAADLVRRVRRIQAAAPIDLERVIENLSLVLTARLSDGMFADLDLRGCTFGPTGFGVASFTRCDFSGAHFDGTDLGAVSLDQCIGTDATFRRVTVDPVTSRLGIEQVRLEAFWSLSVRLPNGDTERVYSPNQLSAVLRGAGLPAAQASVRRRGVNPDMLSLLENLAYVYRKANYVVEGSDDNDFTNISQNALWPKLRKLLVDSDLVVSETRSASGQKRFLRRRFLVEDLMSGLDADALLTPDLRAFWEALERTDHGSRD